MPREWGDWLSAAGSTHAAIEGVAVYWEPACNSLDARFEAMVANAV